MKTIAIVTQKGGTGKTTTAWALACGLHHMGASVLSIDLDGQSDLTFAFGVDSSRATIYDVLRGSAPPQAAITSCYAGDLMPGSEMMWAIDKDLALPLKLQHVLESLQGYDFAVIDCPPSLGMATINAMAAADLVIVPVLAEAFSVKSIAPLADTIRDIKELNPRLKVGGLLLTRFKQRLTLSKDMSDVLRDMAAMLRTSVLETTIAECSDIGKAQANQADPFIFAPRSKGVINYAALTVEVANLLFGTS